MTEDLKISQLPLASTLTGDELLAIVQSGVTSRVSVSSLLANSPSGPYKGTWSSAQPYVAGDVVLHQLQTYQAINNNTNSEPGVGMDWLIQGVDEGAYSINWAGSTIAPTQNSVYEWSLTLPSFLEPDLDNIYIRKDGVGSDWTGDHNAGGYSLSGLSQLSADSTIKITAATGSSYTDQFLIQSTGSTASDYGGYNIINDSMDIGQLFLTSSGYNSLSFIGPRAIGFLNTGTGGMALIADNASASVRFSSGGTSETARFDSNGKMYCHNDAIITDSTYGLVLQSSVDSHYYRYTAGITGALVITDLGTSI